MYLFVVHLPCVDVVFLFCMHVKMLYHLCSEAVDAAKIAEALTDLFEDSTQEQIIEVLCMSHYKCVVQFVIQVLICF